jgi:Rrf2 family protein
MDTRFSAAIHTLILISEAEPAMTSEQIAVSVGTNPSYIRKLTGLLKRAGIIEGHRRLGGFTLLVQPEKLSLLEIYRAVSGTAVIHLFDLHQNPNDACIVGRHIHSVLTETFHDIEEQTQRRLQEQTLADCMDRMREEIRREQS